MNEKAIGGSATGAGVWGPFNRDSNYSRRTIVARSVGQGTMSFITSKVSSRKQRQHRHPG